MAAALVCPRCLQTVPDDAPVGLCPACMLRLGLSSDSVGVVDRQALEQPQGGDDMTEDCQTIPPKSPVLAGDETVAPPEGGFATEPTSSASRAMPVTIPGYEILGELGRGGMGVVYKARHIKLGRLVALKMILAGGHAGSAELARFRTEAEAIARLQHPNIVQVYEISEHDGKPFFSLEFCAAGSLAQKINGTPWRPSDAAQMIETLARAISAAHQKGVVHRDLKPGNVLLMEDGTPKITDFGLAKKLDEASQTQSGAIMGTPSYMAPEQASGKKEIGPGADVYALGAILYELLTGRPPFVAATALDTVMQVVSDDPAPPSQLQSKTPRDLETICLKCLQKDPARRYPSALELADDLKRFQADEPIRARPVGGVERAAKWVKRRPAVAAFLGVSAVAIVGFLMSGGIMWRDAELRAETVQDLALAKGQVAEQQKLVGEKRTEVQRLEQLAQQERTAAEAARKTGRRILYAADMQFAHAAWQMNNIGRVLTFLDRHRPQGGQENLRDFEWHYLHRLCHGERLTLNAASGRMSDLGINNTPIAFSPDGKTLAAATLDQKPDAAEVDKKIRLWDVASGKEIGAFSVPEAVLFLAFTPDGQALLGATLSPDAFKNLTADAIADAKSLTEIMMGKAKPAMKMNFKMYLVQAFTLEGKKLGEPEKLDRERHASLIRQDGRIVSVSVKLKGQAFAATNSAETIDRKTLAVAGISVPADFSKPFATPIPQNAVLFWDLAKEEPLTVFTGIKDSVTGLAFAPDGKTLAGTTGKVIRIWEAPTGKELLALMGHTASLSAVTYSRDGKMVASGSQDGMVKVWDAATGEELNTLKGHKTHVASLVFAPDDKTLASVGADGLIKLWDPRAPQGPTRLKLDNDILQLVFAPDGKSLTATTEVGTRMHWDIATTGARFTGKTATYASHFSTVSPDGNTLAIVAKGDVIQLRDAGTGKELRDLKGHKGTVFHVAFSPNSQVLATASADKSVKLWDVGTGVERCELPVWIGSMAFSPDGKTLATGLQAHGRQEWAIRLWDVVTGKERIVLPECPHPISVLRFSADGTRLAGSGKDTANIWDLTTGKEALTIREPGQTFRGIAFSPDGKRLATNSSRVGVTCEVKLWDAITGQEVLSLPLTTTATNGMHLAFEQQLTFNAQGTRLAIAERIVDFLKIGSKRAEVTIWDATPVSVR